MKILHIITVFSIGGATENTLLTVHGFLKRGYQVEILTGPHISSEGNMYELAERFGVRVFTEKALKRSINIFFDIYAMFRIYKFLKKNHFQIVHTHSSKAGIIGRIASRMAKVPIVIHTIHGLPFHKNQNFFLNKFYIMLEKIGAMYSDKIITVTEKIIDIALQKKIGTRSKFKVIRSGFDISAFINSDYDKRKLRSKFGLAENDIVIGKIARFSELKGHKYLINAVEKIIKHNPEVKVVLVGSGELENKIKKLIMDRGINSNVIFTGLIDYDKIPEIISTFDILVHTSLLEGLARVIPQAYLLKKPVVSFNLDGVSEIIVDNENGFIVAPGDSNGLTEAILKLIRDEDLRIKFGENGFNRVCKEWSQENMVCELEKVYLELKNKLDA